MVWLAERSTDAEHVVLVDDRGTPRGTVPKAEAHSDATALHLAFSCYLRRPGDGAVLLARRARSKRTWPGVWSNACCGHPQLGEGVEAAVVRRVEQELGALVDDVRVLLPDFAYRAAMDDGTVEHELCPVVVADLVGDLQPDAAEVDEVAWVPWAELVRRAEQDPETLSPWCVEQVRLLATAGIDLSAPGPVRPSPSARAVPLDGADPLEPVKRSVEELLRSVLAHRRRDLDDLDGRLGEVAAAVAVLVEAGGKLLRPAFVHWGARAATGGPAPAGWLEVAGSVELLHTFALLHDDVMDRSATRRGHRTAHLAFADQHRDRQATGDPDWFGVSAAILTGDLVHVWADELIDAAALEPCARQRVRDVYALLRREVIAGQHLDLRLADRSAGSAHDDVDAARVALLKSARYTVTRPLLMGAAIAEAPVAGSVGQLSRYGDAVGLAFQMRDDILGLFGDPAATGKGSIEDLREGKRTVLMVRALRLAPPAGRALLERSLGDPELDEATADRCREVVAASGALASIEAKVRSLTDIGIDAARSLSGPAGSALEQLAALATDRRA